jgi:hypothetical protein
MEIAHLAGHRLPNDAFAGSQPAGCIALETLKLPSLGDFGSVDVTLHRGAETVEIRPGSRWNFRGRFPHRLTGY